MKLSAICLCVLLASSVVFAQSSATSSQPTQTVTVSAKASSARIASPNEQVAINGRLVSIGDLMAALSSDTIQEQNPRNPETRSRESHPQAAQPEQKR